eukprot:TRINITY_DN274_c0_g1_i1.p1 TRINITY_DN274_c0_g1~~TRINITY_DN274_c0_g1_i1.p1  ORF type:complete len:645 (+),score=85.80 TRINITY_DN274_c0_g1_i1:200-2134(+)
MEDLPEHLPAHLPELEQQASQTATRIEMERPAEQKPQLKQQQAHPRSSYASNSSSAHPRSSYASNASTNSDRNASSLGGSTMQFSGDVSFDRPSAVGSREAPSASSGQAHPRSSYASNSSSAHPRSSYASNASTNSDRNASSLGGSTMQFSGDVSFDRPSAVGSREAPSASSGQAGQRSADIGRERLAQTNRQIEQQAALMTAHRRLSFASNNSTSSDHTDRNGSRNGSSVSGSATQHTGDANNGSGGGPGGSSSSQKGSGEQHSDEPANFDERMKRWADRREKKKQQATLKKNLGLQSKKEDGTGSWNMKRIESDCLQDTLLDKGLPIIDLEPIGAGNFATVYKGMWTQVKPDGSREQTVVAAKVIKKEKMIGRKLRDDGTPLPPKWLEREVKTNHIHLHENLVRVLNSSVDSLPYVIVLEYCPGGSLHDSIIGDPSTTLHRFTWEHRLKAALDIAQGMTHLHEQKIVHRDLKTLNVLLFHPVKSPSDPVLAKVCDFGLARYLPNDDIQTRLTHQVGSWYYMAPEMFDCKNIYDGKVDVYSYAVVLYEIMAGDLHYASDESKSFGTFVMFTSAGGRPRVDAIPEAAPQVLRELMGEAWRAQPSERPEFSHIAERLRNEITFSPGVKDRSVPCGILSWMACLTR